MDKRAVFILSLIPVMALLIGMLLGGLFVYRDPGQVLKEWIDKTYCQEERIAGYGNEYMFAKCLTVVPKNELTKKGAKP